MRIDSHLRERELAGLPPEFNSSIDFRRPQKIGLGRGPGGFGHQCVWVVHIVAADLMLGAIAAAIVSATPT